MLDRNFQLSNAITKMIILDFQSYSTDNDEDFKKFLKITKPLYEILFQTTFSRIPQMYQNEKENIKRELF